jgi:hypothetical protein
LALASAAYSEDKNMPAPYDYSINVQSPFEAAVSGLKLGATIADIRTQQEAAAKAQERQNMLNQGLQALISNPNPTARDFTNIAMLLPEKEAASMRANWDTLNKDQQDNELRFGGQVMSAFSTGAPQVGINLLEQRAEAEDNAGRADRAKAYRTYAEIAKTNPSAAQKTIGIMLAGVPGGDKVLESSIKALKAPAEVRTGEAGAIEKELVTANTPTRLALENANTGAQIRNIDSQIADRSGRLALDRDKLQTDVEMKLFELGQTGGKLDADARKIVNDATIAAVGSEQSAGRMLDLAGRIESAQGGKGALTKASEWFAGATGRQDEWTQMRQEYTRLRNTQAIKSLPPGPATDKDIQMALKGFPEETANAQTIGSFLRGMAKLQQFEAAAKSAEAEWVNSTGSLGRAKTDINIGGIQVPAGTTFVDFMRQYGEQRAQGLAAQQANVVTGQRGYMRWANPQTGQVPAPGTLGSGTFQPGQ